MPLSCSYSSTEPSKPQETIASNTRRAKQLLPCLKRCYLKDSITQLVFSTKQTYN